MFLKRYEQSQALTTKYTLEPGRTYYRAFERHRGVIELPNPGDPPNDKDYGSPLLEKVTKLCEAVRPDNVDSKLMRLEMLGSSIDEVLSENAEAARQSLLTIRNAGSAYPGGSPAHH